MSLLVLDKWFVQIYLNVSSLNTFFARIATPPPQLNRNKLKYQTLLDTLEDVEGYVTLTIPTTCIEGGVHTYIITTLFKQCYIPLMPIHTCMQHIHLVAIKYLTLLMLNKQNLKTTKPQYSPPKHAQNHHIQTPKSQK